MRYSKGHCLSPCILALQYNHNVVCWFIQLTARQIRSQTTCPITFCRLPRHSTASLGSLFQCFTTFTGICFPIFSYRIPCCNLYLLPLILGLCTSKRDLILHCLLSHTAAKTATRYPLTSSSKPQDPAPGPPGHTTRCSLLPRAQGCGRTGLDTALPARPSPSTRQRTASQCPAVLLQPRCGHSSYWKDASCPF